MNKYLLILFLLIIGCGGGGGNNSSTVEEPVVVSEPVLVDLSFTVEFEEVVFYNQDMTVDIYSYDATVKCGAGLVIKIYVDGVVEGTNYRTDGFGHDFVTGSTTTRANSVVVRVCETSYCVRYEEKEVLSR